MKNSYKSKDISSKKLQYQPYHPSTTYRSRQKVSYSTDIHSRKKFESNKKKGHYRIDSFLTQGQNIKIENKLMPTDQSNNGMQSSIMMAHYRPPNQEYFQQPLNFKNKKCKVKTKRKERTSQLDNLSIKVIEMTSLVESQNNQLKKMNNSLSEREMHRLVKIHSIQKLKMLQKMNAFRGGLKKSQHF